MNRAASPTLHVESDQTPRWLVLSATLVVIVIAAYLRLPALQGAVSWDEADYAWAARQGILANAWQAGELNAQFRHWHAPLSMYAIHTSTSVLGDTLAALRLPSLIASILSCGLLVLMVHDLATCSHPRKWRLGFALAAGLALAFAPPSIGMSATANPHGWALLFILLNLWTLCRYLRQPTLRRAVLVGLTWAGLSVTMEYGPIVAVIDLLAVALAAPDKLGLSRRRPWLRPHREIVWAAAAAFIGVLILWPAGILKGLLPLNFAYYIHYAAGGHPTWFRGELYQHTPRYAYVYWYAQEYPWLLAGLLLCVVLPFLWLWRVRTSVAITVSLFAAVITLAAHRSHIMGLNYSLNMTACLLLAGVLAADGLLAQMMSRPARAAWPIRPSAVLAIALAGLLVAGGRWQPIHPSENAGYAPLVQSCQTLARIAEPNQRVLANASPIVRYSLNLSEGRTDLHVDHLDPRNEVSEHLVERLQRGDYDYVVLTAAQKRTFADSQVVQLVERTWQSVWPQPADAQAPCEIYRRPASLAGVSHE
ncbi:MAG: glycosyltransferase family 39 protein [Phycisphaeraceae bacterium]|nr:glycosyltransferase family 39 protein [Phycisphaeraceae bacterium]